MSNSPLVTRWWPANASNYTAGRDGGFIQGIVIHHAASTSLNSIGTVFSQYGRNGSAHYGVGGTEIHQYVDEANGAWHCSNYAGNMNTVGIETTNSTGAPDWKVSDTTFDTLCKLVADIAKRNNLGKLYVNPDEYIPKLSGHKDWYGAATACPGPYLYPRLQAICDRANAINYPPAPAPAPAPAPKPAISWTNLDAPLELFTVHGAALVDLKTGEVKQNYSENTKIRLVQQAEFNGKTYYRTQYSTEKGFDWAFESTMFQIPESTPEPEPEPSAPPSLSPQKEEEDEMPVYDENKNEVQEEQPQDGSVARSIINWLVQLVQKIINLLTKKG